MLLRRREWLFDFCCEISKDARINYADRYSSTQSIDKVMRNGTFETIHREVGYDT